MKLATIEVISELKPHSNADRLELAKVMEWQSVVKKGDFGVGDLVVFVVIDTVLPAADWSSFLSRDGKPIRLKTVKLRGEFSQGVVFPLSILPESHRELPIGSEVADVLGITKYEKPIPAQLAGLMKGDFPFNVVAKTDEDNALSNPDIVETVLAHDSIDVTMKLDGSSVTIVYDVNKGIRDVCSRNLSLKETDGNAFWIATRKLTLEALDRIGDGTIVIQGELMGPGIQGNQLKLAAPEIHIFQVSYNGTFLDRANLVTIVTSIGSHLVPLIYSGPVKTLQELKDLADAQKLPNGSPAEGIVVRPSHTPSFEKSRRPMGFKIINRNYIDS
jgi:RNA ligase (TIGR02306 family)